MSPPRVCPWRYQYWLGCRLCELSVTVFSWAFSLLSPIGASTRAKDAFAPPSAPLKSGLPHPKMDTTTFTERFFFIFNKEAIFPLEICAPARLTKVCNDLSLKPNLPLGCKSVDAYSAPPSSPLEYGWGEGWHITQDLNPQSRIHGLHRNIQSIFFLCLCIFFNQRCVVDTYICKCDYTV